MWGSKAETPKSERLGSYLREHPIYLRELIFLSRSLLTVSDVMKEQHTLWEGFLWWREVWKSAEGRRSGRRKREGLGEQAGDGLLLSPPFFNSC